MAAKRKCESSDESIGRKKKSFRFSDEMIPSLVDCSSDYKVKCEFSSIDFDADKVLQYKSIGQQWQQNIKITRNILVQQQQGFNKGRRGIVQKMRKSS